jgi:hypothetical protein
MRRVVILENVRRLPRLLRQQDELLGREDEDRVTQELTAQQAELAALDTEEHALR